MALGRFMLVLHSHMPYVLSHGKSPHGTDWLFESAAECYLPLLNVLDRFRTKGIKPRWTVNISPILAEQLDDPAFVEGFQAYCQEKIDAAEQDKELFRQTDQLWMTGIAAMWQRVYGQALVQFRHQWHKSICGAFKGFQDDGLIELITCGATHGYFPLLSTDESIQAQVKLAVENHTKRFNASPKGIWLPECAYRPAYSWKAPAGENDSVFPRKGIETFLAENDLQYFFVDSHMIRGGEPLGTYGEKFPQLAELFARGKKRFTPPEESRSEYEHYEIGEGVFAFARDPQSTVKVWSGDVGYPGSEWYLEFHKQLYPGRLRYWRISQDKADLGAKQPYDPWVAHELLVTHAKDFVQIVKSTLAQYRGQADRTGTLVAMYDTELFGHWWWEGPEFLYEVGHLMAGDTELECLSGSEVIEKYPTDKSIPLPEGSWGEGGYHSVWLNEDNIWTWEKLYPAQAKMKRLAGTKPEGLAKQVVEQCARELLLAEASDWQFLISSRSAIDYAEARFADHMTRFDRLAAMAERLLAGESLNEEDLAFLEESAEKDACFAELDLGWWSELDHPIPATPYYG